MPGIDAGHTRDIMLMLADVHAPISDLADGAARQAAAVLRGADIPTLSSAWLARSPRP